MCRPSVASRIQVEYIYTVLVHGSLLKLFTIQDSESRNGAGRIAK